MHRFRSEVPIQPPIEQLGLRPVAVAGCISRSQSEIALAPQDDIAQQQDETSEAQSAPPSNDEQTALVTP
jgi:hypothetical protein